MNDFDLPLKFIRDGEHYVAVVEEGILRAERYVKIATANVKEIRIRRNGTYVSILRVFEELVEGGVSVRILHGATPSRKFSMELEGSPSLARSENFEMMFCPRSHLKLVLADGRFLYSGSANLTGAGLGVKKAGRRNFETGFVSEDPQIIALHERVFDHIWSTSPCEECERRGYCE